MYRTPSLGDSEKLFGALQASQIIHRFYRFTSREMGAFK